MLESNEMSVSIAYGHAHLLTVISCLSKTWVTDHCDQSPALKNYATPMTAIKLRLPY